MPQKRISYLFVLSLLVINLNSFASTADKSAVQVETKKSKDENANAEPPRRAKPTAFDAIFPNTEYLGPLIGVPNTDPVYPLNKLIWKGLPTLKENNIRIYGWVNPSFNWSSSKHSNIPMTYPIVPNALELDQLVLRIERVMSPRKNGHLTKQPYSLQNIQGLNSQV